MIVFEAQMEKFMLQRITVHLHFSVGQCISMDLRLDLSWKTILPCVKGYDDKSSNKVSLMDVKCALLKEFINNSYKSKRPQLLPHNQKNNMIQWDFVMHKQLCKNRLMKSSQLPCIKSVHGCVIFKCKKLKSKVN